MLAFQEKKITVISFIAKKAPTQALARLGVFAIASIMAFGASPRQNKDALSHLVVIGDSLSAGFQNFSLFTNANGGQTFGFAEVVATQAGVTLTLPTISYPGIPPALTLSGGQIVREAGLGSRTNPETQATNLSVPGFTVGDSLAHAFPGNPSATNPIDVLSDTILGTPTGRPGCGPIPTSLVSLLPLPPSISALIPAGSPFFVSEAACAISLAPSTVIVNIGSNDVLQALTLGLPPTPPAVFQANYHLLMQSLALTRANVVVSNIPDITTLPFLVTPAAFQQLCGTAIPAGADYVVLNLGDASLNVCTDNIPLTQATVASLQGLVAAYNAIIDGEVAGLQAGHISVAVVDLNGLLKTLATQGYTVAGKHLTTNFLGGLFSLDGIHPTNTGYAILANLYIDAMNTSFGTRIHEANIPSVANHDPLVP